MEQKLIVAYIGDHCSQFLDMSFESIKGVDNVVFVWGGEDNKTEEKIREWQKKVPGWIRLIHNKFNQEDPQMNGKARNVYLEILKKDYPNDWALCLDADEVVDNLDNIKRFIQTAVLGLYSVHMRHFHNDLGHEDATADKHWVLNRLFKINTASFYPEVEHPVLLAKTEYSTLPQSTDCTTIWHLAHISHCFSIKARYEKNMTHSNMHSPQYLDAWNEAHCLGTYPTKPVDPKEIPDVILNYFHLDKQKFYFQNRGIEMKHHLQVKQWFDYFHPQSVLDLGCGRGPYLYYWDWLVPGKVEGYEISKWAIEHAFINKITQKDISQDWSLEFPQGKQGQIKPFDLVTAIDVLEHLNDEQLNKTLKNMAKYGRKFIFSMPFIGDPNLEADKTHIQKRTKEDWKKLIESNGIITSDPPNNWYFKDQILLGEAI